MLDLVLVGGGLANGLIAWRLMMTRPDVSFALVEAGPSLGGNRTWSYHGTDVTKAQREWLWALSAKSWPSHDVAFGDVMRRIGGGYHSITSSDFNWKLGEMLKDRLRLRTKATEVSATRVTLKSGEVLEATAVIDGRGLSTTPDFSCGYQKFLGLDVELEQPHGLEVPLLMDARVEQHGAFRFVYLLPWTERRVLVEDTYYADEPSVDLPLLRGRIENYLALRGLKIARVLRQESAALPIPFDGQAPTFTRPTVGVAAGLFNATTGYSLPLAVEVAEAIAARKSFEPVAMTAWLRKRAEAHWRQQAFQRLLNRMLFRGARPAERVKVFTSFYQHGEGLISRFYAGKLNALDKLFVLARGAPSVPGPRAIRAALGDMSPL